MRQQRTAPPKQAARDSYRCVGGRFMDWSCDLSVSQEPKQDACRRALGVCTALAAVAREWESENSFSGIEGSIALLSDRKSPEKWAALPTSAVGRPMRYRLLVPLHRDFDVFRASQRSQSKAQSRRHSPAMSSGCNAALVSLAGSLRAGRDARICGVALARIGSASPSLARLAAARFPDR